MIRMTFSVSVCAITTRLTAEQTQRDEAGFAVVKAVIGEGDGGAGKHLFDPHKVDSMLPNVGLPFGFVPLIPHGVECSYKT